MAEAILEEGYGSWSLPEQSIQVDYALDVLNEIDRTVVEGFNRLRHGGLEVGGVLFGRLKERTVTITHVRHLACEHALGPGFVLSKTDHQALDRLLEAAESDPELQGLLPVGWYHSCTRSHIHLSSQDLELFDRYFRDSSQIALILRPDHFQPTKVGFFFREEDGRIRSETAYREFSLPPLPGARPVRTDREMLAERAAAAPEPAIRAPARVTVDAPVIPPVAVQVPAQPPWRRPAQFTIPSILTLAIIGAWFTFQRTAELRGDRLPKSAKAGPESLILEDHGGHLGIRWNRDAEPVRKSTAALLEITEGGRTEVIRLNADQLHSGSVFYDRSSQIVSVRLAVGGSEMSAVFVGQPPNRGGSISREPVAEAPPVEPAPASPQPEPRTELADRASPDNSPPAKPRVGKPFVPVHILRRPEPAMIALPMPPPEWNSPPALASSPFIGLPVAPPPKSALPAPSRPARTGSFIWTGMLSKSAVLSIEGNRASTGALTGAIPEYPVKVRVYPAELTDAGLKVYSSDQRHPGGSSELPAAHNGWNKTSYIQDSRLGGVVSVLEAPNPRNNWRRLVLRDNGARLSIILIEWEML